MDPILVDIMTEPAVIAETIAEGRRSLPALVDRLVETPFPTVYAVGSGSSNFVGLAGHYAIEEWARVPTFALAGVDFEEYSLAAADPRSLAVVISQSGESFETVSAAVAARQRGLRAVALTNNQESKLARVCDHVVLTRAGREEGPGTKTVVTQCVAVYQFALCLGSALSATGSDDNIEAALAELQSSAGLVSEMLSPPVTEAVDRASNELSVANDLYIVSAGPFNALSLQAANIIREVGKVHCYPFEATEFRHGPLEALTGRSTVLVLSHSQCRMLKEVTRTCRLAAEAGACLVYVGDSGGRPDQEFAAEVLLPSVSEFLAAQIYLPPLQLLSYLVAKKKGLDPNRFVNIVKTWAE